MELINFSGSFFLTYSFLQKVFLHLQIFFIYNKMLMLKQELTFKIVENTFQTHPIHYM